MILWINAEIIEHWFNCITKCNIHSTPFHFKRREHVPCTTGDPTRPFRLDNLNFLIPCECRIRVSPSFWRWEKRAYGHFLQMFYTRDLKSSYLEFQWPSSTTYSQMVVLLFKDDESNLDPESSYALSRRVFRCPRTKFGVRIRSKTQALPATVYIMLDFWLVHLGPAPRQFNYVPTLASRTFVCY
jgi:hypothetical protein